MVSCVSKGNYASETLEVIKILNWRVCGDTDEISRKEVAQLLQSFLTDKIHHRRATTESQ
jgi:hypothetical protein